MPGQFNNNMFLNPQMGMKPAPVQGGGMQQGMPMGGQGQPMPGGPQPMPTPPMGQPPQQGGTPPGGEHANFAMLQAMGNRMPGHGSTLQSQIDDIMGQIQRAQFNGANPMMIAGLQMKLQQLQRQQQESYARQMADMMRNKPIFAPSRGQSSGRGGGGGGSRSRMGGGASWQDQTMQNYQADMWLLQQLMSGGGGGYGPQIG